MLMIPLYANVSSVCLWFFCILLVLLYANGPYVCSWFFWMLMVALAFLLSGVPYCELREHFGEEFFGLCFEENERVLRAVGGNLQDFFNGFDAILEHIRTSTGRRASSESPSFQCKNLCEDRGTQSLDNAGEQRGHGQKRSMLLLHCFNPAPVVGLIMPGLIRAVAKRIFHSDVEVEEVPPSTPLLPLRDTETLDGDLAPMLSGYSTTSPPPSPSSPSPFLSSVPTVCLSFQIQERFPPSIPSFPKATSASFKRSSRYLSTNPSDLRIGLATFCRAFPFHLVLGPRMELLQLGEGLRRQTRVDPYRSLFFRDCFEIVSPRIEPSFQGILLRLASPFTIRTRPDASQAGTKEKVRTSHLNMSWKHHLKTFTVIKSLESGQMFCLLLPRLALANSFLLPPKTFDLWKDNGQNPSGIQNITNIFFFYYQHFLKVSFKSNQNLSVIC